MTNQHKSRYVLTALAVLVASILIVTNALWEPIERKAFDLRFQIIEFLDLGRSKTTGNIVVVGIEEKSVLQEKPLIFWYPDIGKFLYKMQAFEARTVGIDIIPVHALSDKIRTAVLSAYNNDLGRHVETSLDDIGERLDNSLLKPMINVSRNTPLVQAYGGGMVPYYYQEIAFMHNIYPAAAVLTDADTSSNDSVIREQELTYKSNDTIALTLSTLATGKRPDSATITLNYSLGKNIPVYCFSDVMNERVDKSSFSGKTVILGFISRDEDNWITPLLNTDLPPCFSEKGDHALSLGKSMPGAIIHAIIAETVLTRTSLKAISFPAQVLLMIALVGIGLTVFMQFRPFFAIVTMLIIMTIFYIINVILFAQGHVVPIFPHILSPILLMTFAYPYQYIVEERTRKKVYRMFSYYVDKNVIDELLSKDSVSLLKGQHKNVCIVFLDIRDFTRLSQQHSARQLVEVLNLYFGRITEIIQQHNGFVNKFVGDGVLAFFATGTNPVSNALRAAENIIEKTGQLNAEEAFRPFIGTWMLRIGIGVHYGKVVVGNIGSERKMDFTIIGEHVNIASRIEGLTKQVKKSLLISDAAYQMAIQDFHFEPLGDFSIKGIEKPIGIYTLIGPKYDLF